jgi:prevent-host-death family protein
MYIKQNNMDTKRTLPISEARKKFFDIIKDVQSSGRYYTFTKNGWPKAVVLSAEDFEEMQETMRFIARDKSKTKYGVHKNRKKAKK